MSVVYKCKLENCVDRVVDLFVEKDFIVLCYDKKKNSYGAYFLVVTFFGRNTETEEMLDSFSIKDHHWVLLFLS